VSTAVGAALAHGGPAYALLGDLTLLHDTTGFVIGPDEPRPDLTIVVLNDGGGGIFGLLEHGERAQRGEQQAAAFERLFGTPHQADLAALCAGYGVPHRLVTSAAELEVLLSAPPQGAGVVEVRTARAGLRDLHARIRSAVHAAARTELPGAG
jgi:2-succinyl-5-enolpyruvyl-6-hydroxy-3-cyclohexene-1-carboxylate synthase